jgi:hypothetical protein
MERRRNSKNKDEKREKIKLLSIALCPASPCTINSPFQTNSPCPLSIQLSRNQTKDAAREQSVPTNSAINLRSKHGQNCSCKPEEKMKRSRE